MFEFAKDTMTIAPNAYTLRLIPKVGKTKHSFTIVITVLEKRLACGIYVDNQWSPLEIFDMSRMDLKTMDTFKKLLSYKISNHE